MIYLDATAIDTWLLCREAYRQRYVVNRVPAEPSIHQAFGHAVHVAVEAWHKGSEYEECLKLAATEMEKFPEEKLNPRTSLKWRELALALPDCVAVYCDGVEPASASEIEKEWSVPFTRNMAILCGKIDRYASGVLYDVKTASEIGNTWKSDYRATLLRTFQFGLYDWYKREEAKRLSAEQPVTCKVECIVKPYRGKPARLEIFDLPEITVYRKRFDQQLDWVVREIAHYHEQLLGTKPWPMASSQTCTGKFSACDYLPICNGGETPKILAKYKQREEHLQLRKEMQNEQSIQTTSRLPRSQ